ncbi:hypothetical protein [Streptomyces avermitilis]|uniref:hypothetical protein n=1 Tax=Streptomyces avermitilis TaxID=33903 RepID=UPI003720BE75
MNLLGPASRQAVTDAQDQTGETPFLEVLWSWCGAVAEERGLTPPKKNVTAMTARLTAHLTWVAEQPWVVDFSEEIGGLVYAVQKITMTAPRKQLLKGVTCLGCGMSSLVRYFPGDYAAECLNCPSQKYSDRDYELLVQGQARGLESVNP